MQLSYSSLARILQAMALAGLFLLASDEKGALAEGGAFDWFQGLFAPPPPPMPHYNITRKPRPHPVPSHSIETAKPRPPRPKPVVSVPPKPAVPPRYRVAVLGDGLGQVLGQGLTEALADRPDIAILRKARDSTGLVREDVYDWPQAVRDLLTASEEPNGEKIDYAVILIGSNDRQALHEGDQSFDVLSDPWQEIYGRRIQAVAEAFRDHRVPLIWVGLPLVKNEKLATDYSTFNTLYEDITSKTGATFVDVWEAFADEKGEYHAFGPGIDGLITRLRTSDGIHFTAAGARKLAHFVEGDLRRAFAEKSAPVTMPDVPAQTLPATPTEEGAPAQSDSSTPSAALPDMPQPKPDIGPVLPLMAPVLSPGGLLASPGPRPNGAGSAEQSLVKGSAERQQMARPGQADDFSWPRH